MINCPWFCMASYSFRSSSDSSTSWMTTVRGGSLTSGLPSSSSDFSRLMETCLRSFCKRLWAKKKSQRIKHSCTREGTATLRGHPSQAKIEPFAGQSKIFLSYFKTLSIGPLVLVIEPTTSRSEVICSTDWSNSAAVKRTEVRKQRKLRLPRKTREKYKGVVVQSTRPTASWVEIHQISQNKACKKVYESTFTKKKNMQILENG